MKAKQFYEKHPRISIAILVTLFLLYLRSTRRCRRNRYFVVGYYDRDYRPIARRVPVDPVGPLHIVLLAEVGDPLAAVKPDENGNRLQKNIDPISGSWLTDFKIFNIVANE